MNPARIACLFVVSLVACSKPAPTRTEEPTGQAPASTLTFHDGGADMQKRLAGYVGSKVTPEFRGCWGKVLGEGAVAVDLEFRKVEQTWTFDRAVLRKSSLAKGQETTAVSCLDAATRGSSFPADLTDKLESAAPRLVARQGWPIPLPAEGERLSADVAARRFGGGPGAITIEGCSTCVSQKNPPPSYKCESRDSGSDRDCEERPPNACVTTPEACKKDIIYGVGGGLIIF